MDIPTLALAKVYTDSQRLAYSETKKTAVLAETSMEATVPGVFYGPDVHLIVGETYAVVLNGATYTSVCYAKDDTTKYLGNRIVVDGNNTGEPYAVIDNSSGANILFMIIDAESGVLESCSSLIAEIYSYVETVKTIDPKYLPDVFGGGYPVVELSPPAEGGTAMTDAENASLNEVVKSGEPIVVRFYFQGIGTYVCVNMNSLVGLGYTGILYVDGVIYLSLASADGAWTFYASSGD